MPCPGSAVPMLGCCGGEDDPTCTIPKFKTIAAVTAAVSGLGGLPIAGDTQDYWRAALADSLAWFDSVNLEEGASISRSALYNADTGTDRVTISRQERPYFECALGISAVAEAGQFNMTFQKKRVLARAEFCLSNVTDYGYAVRGRFCEQAGAGYVDGIISERTRMSAGVYDIIPAPSIQLLTRGPISPFSGGPWRDAGTGAGCLPFMTRGCASIGMSQATLGGQPLC